MTSRSRKRSHFPRIQPEPDQIYHPDSGGHLELELEQEVFR